VGGEDFRDRVFHECRAQSLLELVGDEEEEVWG